MLELDASAWLREEAASEAELEEESAVGLYLLRPAGWEERLERLLSEARANSSQALVEQLRAELDDARRRIAELEAELRTRDAESAVAESRMRTRLVAELEAAERSRRDAEQRQRDEARRAAQLETELERLVGERASLAARVDSLRHMLERERRLPLVIEPAGSGGSFPSDPLEMATELDRIFGRVRRPPHTESRQERQRRPGHPPPGIRPDRVEIIHWLLEQPLTWLIDGYNVAYQVADEPDPLTRVRLETAARMIGLLGPPGTMVAVVFDSTREAGSSAVRGVRFVYTHSADEWIAEHAGPGTVVVSSDRQVRERAEAAESITVWSEALAEWIRRGHSRS